jgi:uncharacterized membrane protein
LPGPLRQRLAVTGVNFGLIAGPTLGWAAIAVAADEPPLVPGADSFAQLRFLLAQPLTFLGALGNTGSADAARWSVDLVGPLGHLEVEIPAGASALGLGALVMSAALDPGRVPLAARLAALGATLASVFALLSLAYVGWASVGADYIPAFQARYLLPLLPFALVAVPPLPAAAARPVAGATALGLALVLGLSAVAMLAAYYASGR